MKVMLEEGKLFVTNGEGDVFQVQTGTINEDMFLTVYLIPNEFTKNNGVDGDMFTVDVLNETVVDVLKSEGYMVIKRLDIETIQNSNC